MRLFVILLVGLMVAGAARAGDRIEPKINNDGLHYQPWFLESFLDLKEDLAEAEANGKRLAIFFEQRGCIYCTEIHEKVLSEKPIHDFVRDNFAVLQLNLWGDREVTDFDGEVMSEKALARRWGVLFTPTILFMPETAAAAAGKTGAAAAVARMPGAFKKGTFLAMFQWVKDKGYADGRHFQKYLGEKIKEYRESGLMAK